MKTGLCLRIILNCGIGFGCAGLYGAPIPVPRGLYAHEYDKSKDPGHYPFISHLTFQNICDHVIQDVTESFDPDLVRPGDIIYLNIWYLPWFAEEVHDHIRHPYILVSGDVGCWLPETRLNRLLYDSKLSAWFCRNLIFSYHPKLHQIPMGQDFALFAPGNPDFRVHLLDAILANSDAKDHLLYLNFFPRPFGDRDLIAQLFEKQPYCYSRTNINQSFSPIDLWDYYKDLAHSRFALSPMGLELDSVRTWEALALKCIPIVEHTFNDPVYDGLPVVKVHDWKQINEPYLEQKYQELKNCSYEKAFFDYWHKLIIDTQEMVQNGESSFSHLEATRFSDQDLQTLCSILNEKPNTSLFYRGCLTAIRPLQLAKCVSSMFLFDTWMDTKTFREIDKYIQEPAYLQDKYKIWVLESENDFIKTMGGEECSIFIDFTHYRASLRGPERSLRHCLKKGLQEFYTQLSSRCLVCGNMGKDEYVSEVLQSFAEENQLSIEKRDPFWFFLKP